MVMDRRHRVTPVDYCYYYGRLRQPVVPQPTGTSASSAIDLAAAVDHLPSVHGLLCRSESGVDALRYRRQPLVVVVDLPVRFDVSASGGWPSKQTPIVPRSRTRRGFYSRIGRTCRRRRTCNGIEKKNIYRSEKNNRISTEKGKHFRHETECRKVRPPLLRHCSQMGSISTVCVVALHSGVAYGPKIQKSFSLPYHFMDQL